MCYHIWIRLFFLIVKLFLQCWILFLLLIQGWFQFRANCFTSFFSLKKSEKLLPLWCLFVVVKWQHWSTSNPLDKLFCKATGIIEMHQSSVISLWLWWLFSVCCFLVQLYLRCGVYLCVCEQINHRHMCTHVASFLVIIVVVVVGVFFSLFPNSWTSRQKSCFKCSDSQLNP